LWFSNWLYERRIELTLATFFCTFSALAISAGVMGLVVLVTVNLDVDPVEDMVM
jgi:hypothetical protein